RPNPVSPGFGSPSPQLDVSQDGQLPAVGMSSMQTFDFVNRANADYIDQLYRQYKSDPASVSEPWRAYFAGFEMGAGRTDLTSISDDDGLPPLPHSGLPGGHTDFRS